MNVRCCPTCESPRCGNHAACERRHKAEVAQLQARLQRILAWYDGWAMLSAFLYWQMNLRLGRQPPDVEIARIRVEQPLVHAKLCEIARVIETEIVNAAIAELRRDSPSTGRS